MITGFVGSRFEICNNLVLDDDGDDVDDKKSFKNVR